MKKKVLAVTGIRSEYDILFPIIEYLRKSKEFEVKLVVSSAHLSDFHGNTINKIRLDGFVIADKIDCLLSTDRKTQRPKGVGLLIYALTQTVEREKPDFLFVVGDREESIATTIVGNYMNILTVHLGGGDPVWGNADDPIRMSASKLAHLHFTTTMEYAKNLSNLSEDDFRIHFSGTPGLTNIKNTPPLSVEQLSEYLDFDISDGQYIVFIKHPLSSEVLEASRQMKIALEALEIFCEKYDFKVVASYPNTDPGAYEILKVIKQFESKKFIKFNKTLPRLQFVNLMRNTKALAGNSSMGILEGSFYKLPVVNIGNRQQGRLNAGNVVFVSYDKKLIVGALKKAVFDSSYRKLVQELDCPYGNGDAPEKIFNILSQIDPKSNKWLIKSKLC